MQDRDATKFETDVCDQFQYCTSAETNTTPALANITLTSTPQGFRSAFWWRSSKQKNGRPKRQPRPIRQASVTTLFASPSTVGPGPTLGCNVSLKTSELLFMSCNPHLRVCLLKRQWNSFFAPCILGRLNGKPIAGTPTGGGWRGRKQSLSRCLR